MNRKSPGFFAPSIYPGPGDLCRPGGNWWQGNGFGVELGKGYAREFKWEAIAPVKTAGKGLLLFEQVVPQEVEAFLWGIDEIDPDIEITLFPLIGVDYLTLRSENIFAELD